MTWVDGRRLSEIYFDDFGDMLFFDYDSDGMRLRKYGPRVYDYNYAFANTPLFYVDYYYDGDTLIYERRSYNGDNQSTLFTIEYLYGVNGIVGFKLDDGTTQTTYYYVKNIMGDVLGVVDASGTLVAEYRYDAYGNPVMILDGNGNDVSNNYAHIANINPIRYRGYYYDIESGFYYLNSRYYDPEIGRFINADSQLGTGGINGMNLFAYCGNNPVIRKDPSGQSWIIAILLTVAIGACLTSCSNPNATKSSSSNKASSVPSTPSSQPSSSLPASPKVTSPVDKGDYRNDAPSAAFDSKRSNGRTHKGVDYYPSDSSDFLRYGSDGTAKNVYAMADGTVVDYMANFYGGTAAVVVNHGDFYALYGEISTDLRIGSTVTQGQCIGQMKLSSHNTLMLHLEIFSGGYGRYSRDNPYRVDPTYTYYLPNR